MGIRFVNLELPEEEPSVVTEDVLKLPCSIGKDTNYLLQGMQLVCFSLPPCNLPDEDFSAPHVLTTFCCGIVLAVCTAGNGDRGEKGISSVQCGLPLQEAVLHCSPPAVPDHPDDAICLAARQSEGSQANEGRFSLLFPPVFSSVIFVHAFFCSLCLHGGSQS